MAGRDPHEPGRTATTLELLFDLVFVVAFATASSEFAHRLAEGHVAGALGAFAFVVFAVSWAWINFSWFASAFDTDDWAVRIAVAVQMVGVAVVALGIPAVFESIDEGAPLDIAAVVAGYVIMRLAMLALWIRVAVQDPAHRRAAVAYAIAIAVAQIGWVSVAALGLPLGAGVAAIVPLYLIEMAGPVVAEAGRGGTPWHAHHIAERYGLLVIITLGEVVAGTVAALAAAISEQGWSVEAAGLAVGGIGLAVALWWSYFTTPSAQALRHRGATAFVWGYGHLLVFAALAAVGAGLHLAALAIEGHAPGVGPGGVALAVAIPVAVLLVAILLLDTALLEHFDLLHAALVVAQLVFLGTAVAAAEAGAPLSAWLALVLLGPVSLVVAYETVGHRRKARALRRLAERRG